MNNEPHCNPACFLLEKWYNLQINFIILQLRPRPKATIGDVVLQLKSINGEELETPEEKAQRQEQIAKFITQQMFVKATTVKIDAGPTEEAWTLILESGSLDRVIELFLNITWSCVLAELCHDYCNSQAVFKP